MMSESKILCLRALKYGHVCVAVCFNPRKVGRSVLEHVDHVDFLLVTSLFAAEVRFFHLPLTSEVVLFSTATAFTAAAISAPKFHFSWRLSHYL